MFLCAGDEQDCEQQQKEIEWMEESHGDAVRGLVRCPQMSPVSPKASSVNVQVTYKSCYTSVVLCNYYLSSYKMPL